MKKTIKRILSVSGIGLMALASQAYAAGYKLEFQSPSVLADAGEAAVVEDAGTNWYNSAGLVYLPQQIVAGMSDVYAPSSFSGTAVAPSPFRAFGPFSFAATGHANSQTNSLIPEMHYSLPLAPRWAFGLSMVPAWGFAESYGDGSILRYNLTTIDTRTFDIAPSLAYRLNDHWSFGAGPDFHYFSADSSSHVRTEGPAVLRRLGATTRDSYSKFSGDEWAVAGHAGVLFRFNDATRIGLNYRSQMIMDLDGYSDFALGVPFNTRSESGRFSLTVPLPSVTTLSAYHDFTPCWAMMGTLSYERWSILRNYHARNFQSLGTVLPDVFLPQNMHNTLDASIGTHLKMNDKLMFRSSLKYIATPTQTQYRGVNFPDGPKLGIQVGARYQVNCKLAMDMMYGHVWVRTVNIHDVNPVTLATATGREHTSIDILGAQLVYNI